MARPKNPANTLHKVCPTCSQPFTCEKRTDKTYCSKKCACNSAAVKEKNRAGVLATFTEKYNGHPMATNGATMERFKASMLATHGVEHPSKVDGFSAQVKNTKLVRYGDANYNNIDQIKDTMVDRYGVDNYRKTAECAEKVRTTSIKKYGVEHPSQSPQFKDSHKRLMFEKFMTSTRFENFIPKFDMAEYDGVTEKFNRKYEFECKRCGRVDLHDIADGRDITCPKCDRRTMSIFQTEVVEFIQSLFPSEPVLINDRTVIFPLELDIYIPHLKIAIETDGLFYHSEVMGRKNKTYHLNKTAGCMLKGIRLIHVFEHEWAFKRDVVKSVLSSMLGAPRKRIFARKTRVEEISPEVKSAFLLENHLQGNDHSTIKLGLFSGHTLVAVMTFVKSRFDLKIQWEMSRFCTLRGHHVIGGAAKLFSQFIRQYKPTSIVSYSDRRYFSGEMYLKIGMQFTSNTPPNYHYIIDNYDNVQSRINWQKAKLKDKLLSFDESLTEWQNMQSNGFDRIWDCGMLRFIWKPAVEDRRRSTTLHELRDS